MRTLSPADYITADQKAAEAQQQLLAIYSSAIQSMLDDKARERQYDSVLTAVSYLDDPNAAYAAEAAALKAHRSEVWTYRAGRARRRPRPAPEPAPTVEDFLAEVAAACPFAWPS